MKKMLLVMTGGSLGALARFLVNWFVGTFIGSGFAWATLWVNLVGCLLIGLFFALAERTRIMGSSARLFAVTGFLGGLTTFSAYSFETAKFLQSGSGVDALINVLVNNVGGLLLVCVGLWLGEVVLKGARR